MRHHGMYAYLVLAVFTTLALIYFQAATARDIREANVESCQRQNVRIQLQYEKYLADEEESRAFSEQQPPGPIKKITAEAADKYADAAQKLVDLVEEDGVELAPGSPQVDCEEAFR